MGCPGWSSVKLCRIYLGEGRCGPISIDLRLSSRLSSEIPDALAVSKAVLIVLIVLIYLSITPLDLG